jgi:hypothetical protein
VCANAKKGPWEVHTKARVSSLFDTIAPQPPDLWQNGISFEVPSVGIESRDHHVTFTPSSRDNADEVVCQASVHDILCPFDFF